MAFLGVFSYRKGPGGGSCGEAVQSLDFTIGDEFGGTDTFLTPVNGLNEYSWSASIYDSAEMGVAKQITGIEYYVDSESKDFFDSTIKLAHMVSDRFTGTTTIGLSEMNITDVAITYSGSILMSQFGWNTITFDDNFCYNGSESLVVIWENRDGFDDVTPPSLEYDTTTFQTTAYASQDTTFPTTVDSTGTIRPVIKILY